jgi:DNA-directed RNA polymerase subunit M/transcription elongation factor TFIIS
LTGLKMAAPKSQTQSQTMSQPESEQAAQPSRQVMSNCPQCSASLVVLRIIPGRAGDEYWTMRCVRCGGIHLDIVKAAVPAPAVLDSGDLHV